MIGRVTTQIETHSELKLVQYPLLINREFAESWIDTDFAIVSHNILVLHKLQLRVMKLIVL